MRRMLLAALVWAPLSLSADPTPCLSAREIPPTVRLSMWSEYLAQHPDAPHRAAVIQEIERAVSDLKRPRCEDNPTKTSNALIDPFLHRPARALRLLAPEVRDATLNPFEPSEERPAAPIEADGLIDPFRPGAPTTPIPSAPLIDPFAPRAPQAPPGEAAPEPQPAPPIPREMQLDPWRGPSAAPAPQGTTAPPRVAPPVPRGPKKSPTP